MTPTSQQKTVLRPINSLHQPERAFCCPGKPYRQPEVTLFWFGKASFLPRCNYVSLKGPCVALRGLSVGLRPLFPEQDDILSALEGLVLL